MPCAVDGEEKDGVLDAVDFIADLRQATMLLAQVEIGRDVVVIGGGMTAVDAAVQAKLLGRASMSVSGLSPWQRPHERL